MDRLRDKLEFIWLYRAAWLENAIQLGFCLLILLAIILLATGLIGCSIVHYEGKPDGTTTASGYVLGTNGAFEGASFTSEAPGSKRSLSVNSGTGNQTEGIKATNDLIGTVVGAAVKAAAKP